MGADRREAAERRLFAACCVEVASRRVRLADELLAVRVLEAGEDSPLVLAHGSGTSASKQRQAARHESEASAGVDSARGSTGGSFRSIISRSPSIRAARLTDLELSIS
jgi:hypothetical protein